MGTDELSVNWETRVLGRLSTSTTSPESTGPSAQFFGAYVPFARLKHGDVTTPSAIALSRNSPKTCAYRTRGATSVKFTQPLQFPWQGYCRARLVALH